MVRYYIDTCVWRDFYEDRYGPRGKPLGEYATRFFMKVIEKKAEIIISKTVLYELREKFKEEEIEVMMGLISKMTNFRMVELMKEEFEEAAGISKEREVPLGDAIHAIIARDCDAVVVSQDKHFYLLWDVCKAIRPEELI